MREIKCNLQSHPHLLYIVSVLKQQQRQDHKERRISQHCTITQKMIMKMRKAAYLFKVSLMKVLRAVHMSFLASAVPSNTLSSFVTLLLPLLLRRPSTNCRIMHTVTIMCAINLLSSIIFVAKY